MTRTPLIIILAVAAALAGCGKNDHTIVAGPDTGDTATNAAPVALPPSITASKTYRCADNTIVHVDWMSDNKSANLRTDQGGSATQVTAAEAGQPLTAPGGYQVSGSATAGSVRIAVPGHASQSCKA